MAPVPCEHRPGRPGPKAKSLLNFQTDGPISESKENWPTHRGFEEHSGTIPGVENYDDPYGLVHNEQTIKPDTLVLHRKNPGRARSLPRREVERDFYYTDFITDHAVQLIDGYAADSKPFFLYVAYTAPHWPLQARERDVEDYKETYSVGWDAIRQARFDRQVAMGLVNPKWGLSPRAYNP